MPVVFQQEIQLELIAASIVTGTAKIAAGRNATAIGASSFDF